MEVTYGHGSGAQREFLPHMFLEDDVAVLNA